MSLENILISFLILVGSCCAQNTQGNIAIAGSTTIGLVPIFGDGGGPLNYTARTDGCVGSVATPNFTPTNLSRTAGLAMVTTMCKDLGR